MSKKTKNKAVAATETAPLTTGAKTPTTAVQYPVLILLICTCIAFLPSLSNQFVNYDDPENFYNNPLVKNFGFGNIAQSITDIFTTPVLGNYNPLSILSFAIEQMVFGLDHPFFWHLDNLLLHLTCVWLVYRITQLMKLPAASCLLVALLFGIHPMRVESVAWLTERKDVLFGACYLAAIYHYIRFSTEGRKQSQRYILIFFVLSLFSKIQAVTLPLSLLLFDYYFEGKVTRQLVMSKARYFLLSIVFGLLGIYFLKQEGSLAMNTEFGVIERCLLACKTIVVYLVKCILPYQMNLIYPMPVKLDWTIYTSTLIIPLFGFATYKAWKADLRIIVVGLLFFLVNVFFVLQILIAGQGFQADRFTYIPYLGLFFIIAAGIQWLLIKAPANQVVIRYGTYAYLILLAVLTFRQNAVWENSETLWTHQLEDYNRTSTAYFNRAQYYHELEKYPEALKDYNAAIAIEPKAADFHFHRGALYFMSAGDDIASVKMALTDVDSAILLNSKNPVYYANRASIHGRLNNIPAALDDANKSLALDSNCLECYGAATQCNAALQRFDEALTMGEKYLRLKPDDERMKEKVQQLKIMTGK